MWGQGDMVVVISSSQAVRVVARSRHFSRPGWASSPKSLSSVSRARPSALVRASTSSSLMPAEVSERRRRRGLPSSGAQLSPLHALIGEYPGVSALGSLAEDPEYLAGERDGHPRLRPSVLPGATPLEAGHHASSCLRRVLLVLGLVLLGGQLAPGTST
jgi:hypothetical protein